MTQTKPKHTQFQTEEIHYRYVFETTHEIILILDVMNGTIIDANPASIKWLGLSRDQLVDKAPFEIGLFKDDSALQEMLRKLKTEGSIQYDTLLLKRQGNRKRDFKMVANLHAENGHSVIYCRIQEIEQQNATAAALRESEARFRGTFENAAVGIAHVAPDGRWLHINERICRITGYDREELLTKTFQDITHPDDLNADLVQVERLIGGHASNYTMDKRYLRKDGSVVWVTLTVSCIRSAEGVLEYFISVIEDISARKQVELSLEKAHHKLESVLSSITDGLLVLDKDWRYTYFNEQGARMIGMHREQLIGNCVWDVFPQAANNKFRTSYLEAVQSGQPVHFEEFYPEPLNIWLECHCYPSDDGLSVYFRDVTERKQVEAAERQNAALFNSLIEQAPMGVYVVDSRFNLRQVNSEAMPIFKEIHPLLGRDFREVLDILWGPELSPQLAEIFRHTLNTGERYVSPPFAEKRHDLGEEQAYQWETQRVMLPDGQHGVVCYFHEETERVRAEQALRASEERMRLATAATGVGIWEWNILNKEIKWDAEMFRIYGVPPTPSGVVPYQTWSDAVLPEDLPHQEAVLQNTALSGGQSQRKFRIRRIDDGDCRHIESVETVLTNDRGEIERVVGTNLDITERVKADEQKRSLAAALSEASNQKDKFLATLAHELRNPLAPLRSGLQILRRSDVNLAITEQVRSMMERQIENLVHLVNDLLDVSRISRGKLELRRAKVELAEVLNNAIETSSPLIESRGHQLILSMPAYPIFFDADAIRIAQVFTNLLNNAAKYSEPGRRIWLTIERKDAEVVVTIKDEGIGIPIDMLSKIFEIFSQVNQPLEKSNGGLGIGLSLVKRLVELHGGRVEAKSKGPELGSEFVVHLPIQLSIDSTTDALSETAAANVQPSRYRILVADDSEDAAQSLATLLKLMGNEVCIANDGFGAVDIAESFRPNIMFLDIGMPELDGYEACRRIRQQPWGNNSLIVALSGWGTHEDKQRSRQAGFDHHVVKPIDPATLETLLASWTTSELRRQ